MASQTVITQHFFYQKIQKYISLVNLQLISQHFSHGEFFNIFHAESGIHFPLQTSDILTFCILKNTEPIREHFFLSPKSENHNLFAIMELPLNMGRRMQLNTCNTGTDTVHISPLGITASSGLQGKSRQKQQLQQEKNLTIFVAQGLYFSLFLF